MASTYLAQLAGVPPEYVQITADSFQLIFLWAAALKAQAQDAAVTVLGHYPDYVNLGEEIGASFFNIPKTEWDAMTEAEQWAANRRFLDQAIARGDAFRLATPIDRARPGSFFEKEVQ